MAPPPRVGGCNHPTPPVVGVGFIYIFNVKCVKLRMIVHLERFFSILIKIHMSMNGVKVKENVFLYREKFCRIWLLFILGTSAICMLWMQNSICFFELECAFQILRQNFKKESEASESIFGKSKTGAEVVGQNRTKVNQGWRPSRTRFAASQDPN